MDFQSGRMDVFVSAWISALVSGNESVCIPKPYRVFGNGHSVFFTFIDNQCVTFLARILLEKRCSKVNYIKTDSYG